MSRLKLSENLFLEVAELNRLVKFLKDDGYKRILKSMITQAGIVANEGNTNFKVTPGEESNTIKINPGIAFDSNLDAIIMDEALTLSVLDNGVKHWVILSRGVSNAEEGTVSVTSDGVLTGVGTKFTEVLRGQPNFPTKIKFLNSEEGNFEEYEVVSVVSDTSAIISGGFVSESGLKYSVIGTFTPGFHPLEENKQIYEYDSYSIRIEDNADRPVVTDDEFILAYVTYSAGIMSIGDERIYSMFNQKFSQAIDTTGDSPLTSLLVASVAGLNQKSAEIELILEHAYKINSYELNNTITTNIFQITDGSCNFYPSDVPDNVFNGWILLNRANMKYVTIDYNIGKNLYVSNFYAEMIESNNDFIIVPNFLEIEYEVKVNGNVPNNNIPFYFKNSIDNPNTRLKFYLLYPSLDNTLDEVTVSLRYRFIDANGKKYPFYKLAIASFTNVNGEEETLSDSSFVIDMTDVEPE